MQTELNIIIVFIIYDLFTMYCLYLDSFKSVKAYNYIFMSMELFLPCKFTCISLQSVLLNIRIKPYQIKSNQKQSQVLQSIASLQSPISYVQSCD